MSLCVGDRTRRIGQRLSGLAVFCFLVLALRGSCAFAEEQQTGSANKDASAKKDDAAKEPVYQPGGDVKSPKLLHYVEPAFSSSSKEAFVEGVVRITTVVRRDGLPSELHIAKGLNAEEDQKAMEAVAKWRFQPGTKEGQPVNVRVTVEVEFHLL